MPLQPDEVRHVASLARLALREDELQSTVAQLGRILDHVQRLQEVDTEGVPPTAHVLALRSVVRPDASRPGLPQEEAVGNAPAAEAGLFLVPRVVEEGEP
jgi:aspartyl-tRNA(Asn)/glutamyl-tRNA(Gln) amidotransferase subunit C